MPSATKSTDSAKASESGVPNRPNNRTNAAWLVPIPLTVTGRSITSRISGTNAK